MDDFKPFLHNIEQPEPTLHDLLMMREEMNRQGYMEAPAETAAGTREKEPSLANELFSTSHNGGYGCIRIPPALFGEDERGFVQAIVRSVERLEPAVTPMHKAVYRTLVTLYDMKIRATPEELALAMWLAAAQIHGIKIKTHLRDLAKDVHMRYGTLLKIRKVAKAELGHIT